MRIAHSDEIAPRVVSGHRTGDIKFQRLLQGDPNRLDNYELSLVRNSGDYFTPRHRHNFEQIRMILEGEFSWATLKVMKLGQVGYFPEGTPYGPQNVKDCLTLTLQCAGPSGEGFLSYDQLHQGHEEMRRLGTFEAGIFRRAPGANAPSAKKNQDGYEAIWEHVRGRRLVYPKKRYEEPVIMTPRALDWQATNHQGVSRKLLGTFDHEASCEIYRLDAGAKLTTAASHAIQLLFVLSGGGHCDDRAWRRWSAIEIAKGSQAVLEAESESEILRLGIAVIPEPQLIAREKAA